MTESTGRGPSDVRHSDDRPTEELSTEQLRDLLVRSETIDFAAPDEGSIDLPLDDDDGEHVGFVAEPVDPRFVERRRDVARAQRNKKRRKLALIASIPLVVVAVFAVLRSPLADIDTIEILGSETLDHAELEALSGLSVGDPMLLTRLGNVSAALDADPRFTRVTVERRWPNGVAIRATDRRALAALHGPNRKVIVGEGGIVMAEATGEELLGRIELAEDVDTAVGQRLPDALAAAVDVMGRLPFSVGWNVSVASINIEGELILTMTDDVVVIFGTVEGAEEKIHSLVTMLTSNVDRRGVCRIDIRVPASPTMRRAPNCDLPPRPRDVAALEAAQAAQAQAEAEAEAEALAAAAAAQVSGAPETAPTPDPAGVPFDPNSAIVAPPDAAAHADGSNLEPGANLAQ